MNFRAKISTLDSNVDFGGEISGFFFGSNKHNFKGNCIIAKICNIPFRMGEMHYSIAVCRPFVFLYNSDYSIACAEDVFAKMRVSHLRSFSPLLNDLDS